MRWEDVYARDAGARADAEERAGARMRSRGARDAGRGPARMTAPHPAGRRGTCASAHQAASPLVRSAALAAALAALALLAFGFLPEVFAGEAPTRMSGAVELAAFEPEPAGDTSDGPAAPCPPSMASDGDAGALADGAGMEREPEPDARPDDPGSAWDGESSSSDRISRLAAAGWGSVTSEDFSGLSIADKVELVGAMAHDDDVASGVPACLTAAQAILESGWMRSGLSCGYENYFGIKASESNWEGSTWDASDGVANVATDEEYGGAISRIQADFRVYSGIWDSMRDHSAYLVNSGLYDGIVDAGSAEEAVDIIVAGGYATSSEYRAVLLDVIETYDLERFDS